MTTTVIVLSLSAVVPLAALLMIRDRRIAREDWAPYFTWCQQRSRQ